MHYYRLIFLILFAGIGSITAANSQSQLIDNFQSSSQNQWKFFADTVMGGVSSGRVEFLAENGVSFARLSGSVSTENNGGFIQIRKRLRDDIPDNAKGIRLKVRGNNQPYFVHIRTSGTILPWQYYQAQFDANSNWRELRIPLSQFKRSGSAIRKDIKPQSIKSIGIVAFGRDHKAKVEVSEIGIY